MIDQQGSLIETSMFSYNSSNQSTSNYPSVKIATLCASERHLIFLIELNPEGSL